LSGLGWLRPVQVVGGVEPAVVEPAMRTIGMVFACLGAVAAAAVAMPSSPGGKQITSAEKRALTVSQQVVRRCPGTAPLHRGQTCDRVGGARVARSLRGHWHRRRSSWRCRTALARAARHGASNRL
jgi:hypothetical protein